MTIEELINTKVGNPDERTTNNSFSTQSPKLQLAWDSTSLGCLSKCPRYYEYTIIEGYHLPGDNDHLKFGTILHSAAELYDRHIAAGDDHDTALLKVMKYCVIETWDFDRQRPWASAEPTKNRNTILRTVVWYLDRFKDDHLKTHILANGKPAVEFSFSFGTKIDANTNEEYLLCGHLDKAVEWNDGLWIMDKKTTKYNLDEMFFRQFIPDNQMSIYEIAGAIALSKPISGLLIDGIQVLVTGNRFRRRPIPNSEDLLDEFMKDFEIAMTQNETYVENDYWPMNRKACGFGHLQCTFRPVCSADPSVRQELLDALFYRRTWDPITPR